MVEGTGRRVADGLDQWEDLEEVAQAHRGARVLTSAVAVVSVVVDQATRGKRYESVKFKSGQIYCSRYRVNFEVSLLPCNDGDLECCIIGPKAYSGIMGS